MTHSTPSSADTLSLRLYEKGPIRDSLETEFEMVLIEQLQSRGIRMSAEQEQSLHDDILPGVFLWVMEQDLVTLEEGQAGYVAFANVSRVRGEIGLQLGKRLDALTVPENLASESHLPVLGALVLTFRAVPQRIRKFLFP